MRKRLIRLLSATCVAFTATVGPIVWAGAAEAQSVPHSAPRSSLGNLLNDSTPEGFIFKNVAGGVLQVVGGTAFGEVLSLVGISSSTTSSSASAEQVKEIKDQLDAVSTKLDTISTELSNIASAVSVTHQQLAEIAKKLDSLKMNVNMGRLTTLLNNAKPILSEMQEDVRVMTGLANGEYKDQYVAIKRAQVITSLKKLITENALGTLNEVVSAKSGGDDLLHLAFELQWEKPDRFFSNEDFAQANQIVDYYIDQAALLTMLYAEYEYSVVTPSFSAAAVSSVRNEISKRVSAEENFVSTVQRRVPTYFDANWTLDRDPVDGKVVLYRQTANKTAVLVNWYDDQDLSKYNALNTTAPTTAEWEHLMAGRGSASPVDYLRQVGFTPQLSCEPYPGTSSTPTAQYWAGNYVKWLSNNNPDGTRSYAWARYWVNLATGEVALNFLSDTTAYGRPPVGAAFGNIRQACANVIVNRYADTDLAEFYTPRSTPRPAATPIPTPPTPPFKCTVQNRTKNLC